MAYEGYLNCVATVDVISGWVFDDARPDEPLTVAIECDGRVVAEVVADGFRPDLKAAGKGDGRHAFAFRYDPPTGAGVLSARVVGRRWSIPNGGPAALDVSPRFLRNLTHSFEFGWPPAEGGFTAAPDPRSVEPLVERLLAAYRKATADDPARSPESDVWSDLQAIHHRSLANLLRKRDVTGLARYLSDAHAQGITHGITQGDRATAVLRGHPEVRRLEVGRYCDYLASLAEYLGVLDVESPEQRGRWAENVHESPDELVRKVSDRLGIAVVPPEAIGSLFGLRTASGIVANRDLLGLYAACRLRESAAGAGLDRPSVCEIGGGVGACAHYAHLLGVTRYAIVDLPVINLLQGFHLIRSLPAADVRLYGEAGATDPDISILPTWAFGSPASSADFLFNSDSFPEMHRRYAVDYLRRAPAVIARGLLSVNQEARATQHGSQVQLPVRELVHEAGGYRRVSRFRHWLRPDYVEEYFALDRPR